MHGVVFQEQIEQRWIQFDTFFNAQTLHQGACGTVTDHALNRHHIQFFYQTFRIGQQRFHLSRDTGFGQFGHNEVVELVIHHALTIELLNACAVSC
ncbi:Uncharacterised protein [Enterobacter cloacae]|nr:Uncharacterised protein [Enterobacter cloacae]